MNDVADHSINRFRLVNVLMNRSCRTLFHLLSENPFRSPHSVVPMVNTLNSPPQNSMAFHFLDGLSHGICNSRQKAIGAYLVQSAFTLFRCRPNRALTLLSTLAWPGDDIEFVFAADSQLRCSYSTGRCALGGCVALKRLPGFVEQTGMILGHIEDVTKATFDRQISLSSRSSTAQVVPPTSGRFATQGNQRLW
jgi:hypothetical protein